MPTKKRSVDNDNGNDNDPIDWLQVSADQPTSAADPIESYEQILERIIGVEARAWQVVSVNVENDAWLHVMFVQPGIDEEVDQLDLWLTPESPQAKEIPF